MRIELVFGGPIGAGDALLIEGDEIVATDDIVTAAAAIERFAISPHPLHGVGCTCCAPRGPAADALGRLFLARARGDVAWFSRVVVLAGETGVAAVRAALSADALTIARYSGARHSGAFQGGDRTDKHGKNTS